MATFSTDSRGGIDDRVRITLDRSEAQIVESYTVRQSFLTQPSTWSIHLGHGAVVAELLDGYPPGITYRLYIGSVLQQTGLLEDQESSGDATGGSTVTFSGRDAMAPLLGHADADLSFTDASYARLTRSVLDTVVGAGKYTLAFSNNQNRSTQVGSDLPPVTPPINPDGSSTAAAKERPMRIKAGEEWLVGLRNQLDRAGMFLMASANGGFILTAPNPDQPPVARIVRRRGLAHNDVNVVAHRYRNATSSRYSRVVIHARGGGGKQGRQKTEGKYTDQEMVDLGFDRPLVVRDHKCSTPGQSEAIARRKIAESRRASWNLSYTLAGHTAPRIDSADRIVWAVDTVVEVDDQELGLRGSFWVETVEFSRGPETRTTITLMRPGDLVFGGEDE